jgi:hypothetical protein
MAADLWSAVLGAKTDVAVGMFAGPAVWAVLLLANYAVATDVCHGTAARAILHVMTVVALVLIAGATFLAWRSLHMMPSSVPTDANAEAGIQRFLVYVGAGSNALFACAVIGSEIAATGAPCS